MKKRLIPAAFVSVCCCLLAAQTFHAPGIYAHFEVKPAAVRISDYVSLGGIRFESSAPAASLTRPASQRNGVTLTFPVLNVHSPQGELVCHASSQPEIERIVEHFPRSIRHLRPIRGADNLDEVYRKFSALARERSTPPGYTFLSLKLDSCEACDVEAGIVAKAQHRLESHHVQVQTLVLEPQ